MRYLHTMVRVRDLDASLDFYCNKLGLVEANRFDNPHGRFTLVFLSAPEDAGRAKDEQRAAGRADLQLGSRKTMRAGAISATWPMRSTTSTPSASG